MGYQESYIFTNNNNDLNKIVDIFKRHNIRTTDDWECSCVAKIKLNKNVKTNVSIFGESDIEDEEFENGKEFLYMSGERYPQRSVNNLFDTYNIDYTEVERNLIDNVSIIFTEYMPSSNIFNSTDYASVEDIKI